MRKQSKMQAKENMQISFSTFALAAGKTFKNVCEKHLKPLHNDKTQIDGQKRQQIGNRLAPKTVGHFVAATKLQTIATKHPPAPAFHPAKTEKMSLRILASKRKTETARSYG